MHTTLEENTSNKPLHTSDTDTHLNSKGIWLLYSYTQRETDDIEYNSNYSMELSRNTEINVKNIPVPGPGPGITVHGHRLSFC